MPGTPATLGPRDPNASEPLPDAPPIVGPVPRLRLIAGHQRLKLSSRGPIARAVLPWLNAAPAAYVALVLAFVALLTWAVAVSPSTTPPPSGGAIAVLVVAAATTLVLPVLLGLTLLSALRVGDGFSLTIDADTRRCRIRRSRLGLLPLREECELEDLHLDLLDALPPGLVLARRRRSIGGVLLVLLTLVNPLFLVISLAFRRGQKQDQDAEAPDLARLQIATGDPASHGWLLLTADHATAEAFCDRWARARSDRFRFGFTDTP